MSNQSEIKPGDLVRHKEKNITGTVLKLDQEELEQEKQQSMFLKVLTSKGLIRLFKLNLIKIE